MVHQTSEFKCSDVPACSSTPNTYVALNPLFQSAEVVNQMVAVERVIGFRDLAHEAPLSNNFDEKVSDWPSSGEIDVQSLSVRYRDGLPLSLRGVSFHIKGGSRVGVVGRTGGGK